MCTRPDHRSVPATAAATRQAMLTLLVAIGLLLVAASTVPVRLWRKHRVQHRSPAPVSRIDIQVHLEDATCVAELKRLIRQTLSRAARTWSPLPLPIHRVVVGVGFPSGGKIDAYDNFPAADRSKGAGVQPLVLISLGLRDGERELETSEIAGVLAALIQRVIDDRYRETRTSLWPTAAPPESPVISSNTVGQPEQPVARPVRVPAIGDRATSQPTHDRAAASASHMDLPTVEELLAQQQKSQPLAVAGSASNGTHP
jgi:hypothetical protein